MYSFMETLEFDLPGALLTQLVALLDDMPSEKLERDSLRSVPEEQGVYQLFVNSSLVYIGKTDSDAGLKKRLLRHCAKIGHRTELSSEVVFFKAVRIYVFTAMDLESQLIKYYKGRHQGLEWQNSGFGSNDPGRERDSGKPGSFDSRYPIDIDIPLGVTVPLGEVTVSDALDILKNNVPYTIRFERQGKSREPHKDLLTTKMMCGENLDTARKILLKVKEALGEVWQITLLPGYVIIYKENRTYNYGVVLTTVDN